MNMNNRDVLLIGRSMLEGYSQLFWIARQKNFQEQAKRFRLFAFIEDWRTLRRKLENNERVQQAEIDGVRQRADSVASKFYTKEAQKRRSQSRKLPDDPFIRTWHGKDVAFFIRFAQTSNAVYESLYKEFCDYHHWNTAGLARSLKFKGGHFTYSSISPRETAMSLSGGLNYLSYTAQLVSFHFKIGMEGVFQEFHNRFNETIESFLPCKNPP